MPVELRPGDTFQIGAEPPQLVEEYGHRVRIHGGDGGDGDEPRLDADLETAARHQLTRWFATYGPREGITWLGEIEWIEPTYDYGRRWQQMAVTHREYPQSWPPADYRLRRRSGRPSHIRTPSDMTKRPATAKSAPARAHREHGDIR